MLFTILAYIDPMLFTIQSLPIIMNQSSLYPFMLVKRFQLVLESAVLVLMHQLERSYMIDYVSTLPLLSRRRI